MLFLKLFKIIFKRSMFLTQCFPFFGYFNFSNSSGLSISKYKLKWTAKQIFVFLQNLFGSFLDQPIFSWFSSDHATVAQKWHALCIDLFFPFVPINLTSFCEPGQIYFNRLFGSPMTSVIESMTEGQHFLSLLNMLCF